MDIELQPSDRIYYGLFEYKVEVKPPTTIGTYPLEGITVIYRCVQERAQANYMADLDTAFKYQNALNKIRTPDDVRAQYTQTVNRFFCHTMDQATAIVNSMAPVANVTVYGPITDHHRSTLSRPKCQIKQILYYNKFRYKLGLQFDAESEIATQIYAAVDLFKSDIKLVKTAYYKPHGQFIYTNSNEAITYIRLVANKHVTYYDAIVTTDECK